jgi:hypothetical protein
MQPGGGIDIKISLKLKHDSYSEGGRIHPPNIIPCADCEVELQVKPENPSY